LIPGEVRSKVLGLAGKGSALIIEMLWSTSAYLPAHNGGLKYKEPLGLEEIVVVVVVVGCWLLVVGCWLLVVVCLFVCLFVCSFVCLFV